MLEIIALYLDEDGLPRAHAVGLVEKNEDLDEIKLVARDMLHRYIQGPYPLNKDDFILSIEIVD